MRQDPEVTEPYRKNEDEEHFLSMLNDALESLEATLQVSGDSQHPLVFVLGLPRSGTTIVSQAIISRFGIGYVSNLTAAFWKAPVCGVRLARKLLTGEYLSCYQSDYGRTKGASEPHEFGYFWSTHLGYTELAHGKVTETAPVDWAGVSSVLNSMAEAQGAPFLFKNLLCNWHASDLAASLSRSCFIVVKRNATDNALSLLNMRENMLGDRDKWASAKPAAYEWLKYEDCWTQVAGQVRYLQQELDAQIAVIAPSRVLEVDLEKFCASPSGYLERVADLVQGVGGAITGNGNPVPVFRYRDLRDGLDADRVRIERAFSKFSR